MGDDEFGRCEAAHHGHFQGRDAISRPPPHEDDDDTSSSGPPRGPIHIFQLLPRPEHRRRSSLQTHLTPKIGSGAMRPMVGSTCGKCTETLRRLSRMHSRSSRPPAAPSIASSCGRAESPFDRNSATPAIPASQTRAIRSGKRNKALRATQKLAIPGGGLAPNVPNDGAR